MLTPHEHGDLAPDVAGAVSQAMAGSESFGHREHVHLAWIALRAAPETAGETLCRWLSAVAAHHGSPQRFHRTLTLAWTAMVRHHLTDNADFDGFIARNPGLLDPSLPGRHWSKDAIFSDDARTAWVDPDLLPLPAA